MKKITSLAQHAYKMVSKKLVAIWVHGEKALQDEQGQSTVEYAILVGILVVIAILAIVTFRSKLELLWQMIADAINSL